MQRLLFTHFFADVNASLFHYLKINATHSQIQLTTILIKSTVLLIKHYTVDTTMYVCICNGITDKQIREAVLNGADSFRDVRNQLGIASQCGQCTRLSKDIIKETLADCRAMNSGLFYSA